nr:hypothetical protein [Tanacetum cinerariifolium]
VKEKQSDTTTLNVENTGLNSYPPLPMMGSTPPCNRPGKSSYANVTGKPSGKKLNFHTLFTPGGEDGLSAIATKLGTPLMLHSYTANMCMQSWGRSRYARDMIELKADVELKDNIVAAMPKISEGCYYTCNICVEYE